MFQESGKILEDNTIDDVTSYFQVLHEFEVKKGRFNRASKCSRDDDDDSHTRVSNKKKRGRRNRDRKAEKQASVQATSKKRACADERCLLHPNSDHLWSDCRCNPKSDNFQPRDYKSNARGDNPRARKVSSGRRTNGKFDDVNHADASEKPAARRAKRSKADKRYNSDTGEAEAHYMETSRKAAVSSIFDDE